MDLQRYFTILGILIVIMAFAPTFLRKLRLTPAILYLVLGVILGPYGIGALILNESGSAKFVEVIAELTVIISLFTVGLKLRIPLHRKEWLAPVTMASVSMVLSIAGIAVLGNYFFGFGIGEAILLGAVLSPTDPVLASVVQLRSPEDTDQLRFALTAEGGLNDGMAFPFVMLGLGLMGLEANWSFSHWVTVDLLWAIFGGVLVGCLFGLATSLVANFLQKEKSRVYLEDFLTIGSILLSYGLTLELKAYGFLAVFFTALTIRQLELKSSTQKRKFFRSDLPKDVLSFNEQLERIFEFVSVVTVGSLVSFNRFEWEFMLIAALFLLIIRPFAVVLPLLPLKLTLKERFGTAWFGVRGIGSIYYLFFAMNHGFEDANATRVLDITVWVIVLSVIFHGVSARIFSDSRE
jgi:sodium/hydrogen antiporter